MSTYAVSDLHGMMPLYTAIKDFLKPEDKVFCLGDCGDRGPDGWELIKAVYKDPQFEYLMGNHEDILVNALSEYFRDGHVGEKYWICASNGGESTFDSCRLNDDEGWMHILRKLPTEKIYDNQDGFHIILTHSGYTPNQLSLPSKEDKIWNRDHILDPWPTFNPVLENTVLVHGHTPIPHMRSYLFDEEVPEEWSVNGALYYCGGHKVCIDCASFISGATILLDLDTFDEHIFYI